MIQGILALRWLGCKADGPVFLALGVIQTLPPGRSAAAAALPHRSAAEGALAVEKPLMA